MEMKLKSAKGFWNLLPALGKSMTSKLMVALQPFADITATCYECGMEVPTLPHARKNTKDIRIAALFLKRCLNDLRATWILLTAGYTSQAGAVAAAAFENTLVISSVLGKPNGAEKLAHSISGDVPWTVAEMCKVHIKGCKDRESQKYTDEELEYASNMLYAHYVWLCMIKHPNMQSVIHDALSTKISDGQYAVMVAPDTRPEDLPNKAEILAIILNRIACAIDDFGLAYDLDHKHQRVTHWQKRLDSILPSIHKVIDPIMEKFPNTPVDIGGSRFVSRLKNFQK
jgi:hypothetical protein